MTLPYNTCSELPDKLQFIAAKSAFGTMPEALFYFANYQLSIRSNSSM